VIKPSLSRRQVLRATLLALGCAFALAWLWSGARPARAPKEHLALAQLLLDTQAPCALDARAASVRARELERQADASWERLPFDAGEAPRAVLQAAEAERCHRVAGDREGGRRAAFKRHLYESDLKRRWARTQLLLELARRRGDAAALQREVATQLALSSRAGEPGRAYRAWLEQLDRAAEAHLTDQMVED
jgi:hypothetical protein